MMLHEQLVHGAIGLGFHQATLQTFGQRLIALSHKKVDGPGVVERQCGLHHQIGIFSLTFTQLLPCLVQAARKCIESTACQHAKQRLILGSGDDVKAVVLQQRQIGPLAAKT